MAAALAADAAPASRPPAAADPGVGQPLDLPDLPDLPDQPVELTYVGSVGGMEAAIVARESQLPYRELPAAALRGRGPRAMLRGSATMLAGVRVARHLLQDVQPAAILGTGGYVCVPLFVAARRAGIPTLIYLPDVVPGLAVRLLARIATQVACSVPDSARYLPRRGSKRRPLLVTGYPVRAELFGQDKAACRAAFGLDERLPVLLVYGGSRGARSVNQAVAALLPDLLALAQIIHVCGREGDESWLRAAAEKLDAAQQARYRLYPYLEGSGAATMARAFGAADLALCRSGASTMAELPAAALPAVLVPYPYVHQDENADYLVRNGAALKVADAALLDNDDPRAGALFPHLRRLLTETHERNQMAQRSASLARPDAARQLASALCDLATRRGSSHA